MYHTSPPDPYEIAEQASETWEACYITNWNTDNCKGYGCKGYDKCMRIAELEAYEAELNNKK